DDDKEGCQNQEENPAETPQKMCKGAVPVAEGRKRSEDKVVNHGKRHAESSANDGIEKRLAETALALHRGERGDRSTQNHLQSFNKRVEQSFRLALVPWQSAARHGHFRDCGCWASLRRGHGRRRHSTKLRKLRERLPGCHSFAPAEIGGKETAGS